MLYIFNTINIWAIRDECRRLGLEQVRLVKHGTLWCEAVLDESQAKALECFIRKA